MEEPSQTLPKYRNFKCLFYLQKSRIPAQLNLSVISGLLTFRKWPEISARNPERSGYGIFTVSTVPKFYLPYPILISTLAYFYPFTTTTLLYSTLFYSSKLPLSLLRAGSLGWREVRPFWARRACWSLLGCRPGYPWCKGSRFRSLVCRLLTTGNFRVALCIHAGAQGCWC